MGKLTNLMRWKEILSAELPGEETQLQMAPTFRGVFHHEGDPVHAAVLILMYPREGEINVVFMKRNAYDGPHSAQVSFPGGAWEKGDRTLENTAVRETREELGIAGQIEILGSLSELHIPVSNYQVTPFVGWMEHAPTFHPDPSEVQYVIETTLQELMDPENRASEILSRHGQSIDTPYYKVGNEKIWGATAMMLCEFLQLVSSLQ